ncbi:MAG TPA: RluA family pseudouridine synthase [Bacteroidota bacterium]|nr:RluA family pseudouridine synthase [Bacteroidota bacterium]
MNAHDVDPSAMPELPGEEEDVVLSTGAIPADDPSDEVVSDEDIPDEDAEGDLPIDVPDAAAVTRYELRSAPNAQRVRLDQFITRGVENASRNKVQALIEAGGVRVNERVVLKPGRLVLPGDVVECIVPKPPPPDILPEDIPLDIVYEDDALLIVNKPAGMVTHPAYANYSGTLVNALMHYTGQLSHERGPERAGILHRLDKGTSGLLAVAKTDEAHRFIAKQFSVHDIEREYQAIVWGGMPARRGLIEQPLARHPSDRKKMAVVEGGKYAATEYEVITDYGWCSHVRLLLRTGRTHQIRVHLAHLRHPVLGDPTYGGRRILYGTVTTRFKMLVNALLTLLPRQALHARTLGFVHPVTREKIRFESALPEDMQQALALIAEAAEQ